MGHGHERYIVFKGHMRFNKTMSSQNQIELDNGPNGIVLGLIKPIFSLTLQAGVQLRPLEENVLIQVECDEQIASKCLIK